jgi:hypothetical protein
MTLYTCECGKEEKEISKATIVYRNGKWVTKEAECSCGLYMDSEPTEGMPTIKRTEPSLTKKRDKLWAGAKEKLVGERGINEDFK